MLVFQKKTGTGSGLSIASATFQTQHDIDTITGEDGDMIGFVFKPDGTKMWTLDNGLSLVKQWSLSTPWDLTTLSYDSVSMSVSGQLDTPLGIDIRTDDGTRLYVSGRNSSNPYIRQYNMSVGWDLSTASFNTFLSTGAANYPTSMVFKPDGTHVFLSNAIAIHVDRREWILKTFAPIYRKN